MDYSFTCVCGFSTQFTETAKIHLSRCLIAKAPDSKETEPIDTLAKALEQINEIISKALIEYKKQKALKR